ncbi:MAG: hypothetical protein D6785_14595 [Planctomycetota bacterium]|nr:MAG: hypothetical protein D6785_14595 [Planctomycetota bacterium]
MHWKGKFLILAALFALSFLPFASASPKVNPKVLGKNLKRFYGEQVIFTDQILFLWKKQPLKKKDQSGFFKFETAHVRCLIRETDLKTINFLKKYLKTLSPQMLTIYGTVVKKRDFEYYVEVFKIEIPKYVQKKD